MPLSRITSLFQSATANVYSPSANTVAIRTSSTDRLTLDSSGNVGIGTTSPADILHLSKAGDLYLRVTNTSTGINAYLGQDSNGTYIGNTGASVVRFIQGASERMRLDTSGNLALGVTPSAWGSNYRAIEVSGAVNVFGNTGDANFAGIGANLYHNNTNYLYRYSTLATMYLQDNGTHQWHIAPSGTANTQITFTQAMTLDASGNLLVGTTSNPGGYRVEINGELHVGIGSENRGIYLGPDGFTPSLRYNSNGNLDIAARSGYSIAFLASTGGTERARIDGAGIFKLSATGLNSSSAYFYQTSPAFNSGSSSKYSYYSDSGTKNFGIGFLSDVNGSQAAWMTANSTDLGWVLQTNSANGVRLANAATSWSSYSDERLKNIIEEIPQALSKVSSIRAVRFSWKDDETNAPRVGVIAQDVQAVLPEVVDDDTDYMQVRYSELVPLCIKAIQELNAKVEAQAAEIAALKAQP